MNDNFIKVLMVGPMGVGKSQLCNYIQNDYENRINKVSDSLESCTQDPKSNKFNRIEKNFDFIDTAGNNDSDEIDILNLEKLVNYLKRIKKIHYIILVLKFGERFTGDTKQYIEALGKIFTIREFFCHLSIVFTKFPNDPKEEDLSTKDKFTSDINRLLKNIFQPDEIDNLPANEIYFINSKYDRNNELNNKKNQEIVDKILNNIILCQSMNSPINTENLDITGKNAKLRRQLEIEKLRREIEQERKNREIAEIQAREARRRAEDMEAAYERERKYRKEIENLKNKNKENEREINEEREKKNNKLKELDNMSQSGKELVKNGGIGLLGSIGLGLLGAALTSVCPIVGPGMVAFAVGSGASSAGGVAIGGAMTGIAEAKKKDLYLLKILKLIKKNNN